ncbi:HNH endonuclease signature motif containing protein [Geodermatophilus africanus]|nr:HNH endonuclease signature motif containing protein [Geodermatophilus africanus]
MDDGAGTVSAPVVGWASGPLGAVQAADREIARQTAVRARAVAAFAASRPASVDRAQGEPGAMSAERWAARPEVLRAVSEWATPELAIALNLTRRAAEVLLEESLTLVSRLPATLGALECGLLHRGHLWHLLDKVAPVADDGLRAEIEAELLTWVGRRRTVTSPAQLGDKARVLVAKRDAAAAGRRLARALAERGVSIRPDRVEGMGVVSVYCALPEARAFYGALVRCAEALVDEPGGPVRTRGQKMVDALLDLVLRPGETELPPVRVLLTIVASVATMLGGDAPAELDGEVLPAELARQLVRAFAGQSPVADVPEAEPAPAVAWQEVEQAELAAWWDEVERRLFAGELLEEPDGEPDPLSADDLTEVERDGSDWPPGPGTPRLCAAEDAGTRSAGMPDSEGPPDTDRAPSPDTARPPGGDPPPGGWWAAADRAVEGAGAAVHAARTALGHAARSVRTAAQADAADEAVWAAGPAGQVGAATDTLGALAVAADAQRERLAALLDATAGGGLADRPRLVLADAVSGALLTLTDLPGLRRTGTCGKPACRRRPQSCTHDLTGRPGLAPPDPTDGYRPTAALDRQGRARDRRCRFPGCRRRVPDAGELDHHRPHAVGGRTAAANLAGYCTGDHRGKHQAPGWRHDLAPDGTLTVTTPTGLTAVTEPPPY